MVSSEAFLIFQCFLQGLNIVVEEANSFPGLNDLIVCNMVHSMFFS